MMPSQPDEERFKELGDDEFTELQDLHRLFDRSQPPHKEVDVEQIASKHTRTFPNNQKRWTMSFRAAVVAAVAGTVFYLLVFPLIATSGIAFADVKAEVEKIRTVEYVETSFDGDQREDEPQGESFDPTLDEVVAKLESSLKAADGELARDMQFELDVLNKLQKQESKVLYVKRIRVKGKSVERTDGVFPLARHHFVRSALTGLNVAFDHNAKQKEVLNKQVSIDLAGNQKETEIKKIPPTVDFFARFRSVPSEATERLPDREIGGKRVLGFRSSKDHKGQTWTRTYWVLPDSKLPVEMWTEIHRGEHLEQRWVMDQFVFDRDMDDGLFSTETPEGYTSKEGKVYGLIVE